MKKLRLLVCTVVVTFGLSLVTPALAQSGCTETTPCACDPGETHGPPCASAQPATDDSTNPEDTQTSPAAETVVITTIADAAVGALLSLF